MAKVTFALETPSDASCAGYPAGAAHFEVGCKVEWLSYRDRETAEEAARAARTYASEKRAQGYDFGYCSPGSIEKVDHVSGVLYRVCCP